MTSGQADRYHHPTFCPATEIDGLLWNFWRPYSMRSSRSVRTCISKRSTFLTKPFLYCRS
jgi:hypothetical protein